MPLAVYFFSQIIGTGCCINTPICQVTKYYHNFVVLYRRVLSNIDLVSPLSIQYRQQAVIFAFFSHFTYMP